MNPLFEDYFWKDGMPQGRKTTSSGHGFKIISDPYRKRISIERYVQDSFAGVIYDSILLDFRHLKDTDTSRWERILVSKTEGEETCLIRNQEDRLLFSENYYYEDNLCRECHIFSIHGLPLGRQQMFYTTLGDPFDGVFLFDNLEKTVMYKHYEFNPHIQAFDNLIEESWITAKN